MIISTVYNHQQAVYILQSLPAGHSRRGIIARGYFQYTSIEPSPADNSNIILASAPSKSSDS